MEFPVGVVTVRRVHAGDAHRLRAVRLRALQDAPSAFGSTYAAESQRTPEEWEAWAARGAAGEASASFLAEAGGEAVGLVGGYRPDPNRRELVELVSMWTAPEARRRGVASLLVRAVLEWAAATGGDRVELWVTRGNDAALALYESLGFALTGDHQPLPSDPCKDEVRMARWVVEPPPTPAASS